ncbi:TIR domain-containing protein [Burkholderia aenigmatica]|uniref:TIR domain-containing protein n=1 Tax=Burkholderia aenigmatica TaxID=2015348 RepID=UPI001F06A98D|nr:TIR domain-containing protein [Burkholderia aenigmatica]
MEANRDVGFAVVLLSPDDEGRAKDGELQPRARQNVVLALGNFMAHLSRLNIHLLRLIPATNEVSGTSTNVEEVTREEKAGKKLAFSMSHPHQHDTDKTF